MRKLSAEQSQITLAEYGFSEIDDIGIAVSLNDR
jgi:hypothetical protein